jgi:hypothetical protein
VDENDHDKTTRVIVAGQRDDRYITAGMIVTGARRRQQAGPDLPISDAVNSHLPLSEPIFYLVSCSLFQNTLFCHSTFSSHNSPLPAHLRTEDSPDDNPPGNAETANEASAGNYFTRSWKSYTANATPLHQSSHGPLSGTSPCCRALLSLGVLCMRLSS